MVCHLVIPPTANAETNPYFSYIYATKTVAECSHQTADKLLIEIGLQGRASKSIEAYRRLLSGLLFAGQQSQKMHGWCGVAISPRSTYLEKANISRFYVSAFIESLVDNEMIVKALNYSAFETTKRPNVYKVMPETMELMATLSFTDVITRKSECSVVDSINAFNQNHPFHVGGNIFHQATRFKTRKVLARCYGGWTNQPRELRLSGTIDGEPVAEVDLGSINLTLLLAIDGTAPSPIKELYNIDGWSREQVKSMVTATIGKGRALKRLPKKHLFKSLAEWRDCFSDVCEHYPAMGRLEENQVDSTMLSEYESNIVIGAQEALMNEGIPSYNEHDGIICKQSDIEAVKKALQMSASRITKLSIFKQNVVPSMSVEIAGDEKQRFLGGVLP